MSSFGGNTSETYSFAAPGEICHSHLLTQESQVRVPMMLPLSRFQPIPWYLEMVAPECEAGSLSRARGVRRSLRALRYSLRSTSPRMVHNRFPKKSIEKVRITSGSPDHREASREVQLLEELRSSNVAYQFLHEEHSTLQSGCAGLHRDPKKVCECVHNGRTIETRLQEMAQEDEGATIRIGELEHELRLAEQMADI